MPPQFCGDDFMIKVHGNWELGWVRSNIQAHLSISSWTSTPPSQKLKTCFPGTALITSHPPMTPSPAYCHTCLNPATPHFTAYPGSNLPHLFLSRGWCSVAFTTADSGLHNNALPSIRLPVAYFRPWLARWLRERLKEEVEIKLTLVWISHDSCHHSSSVS